MALSSDDEWGALTGVRAAPEQVTSDGGVVSVARLWRGRVFGQESVACVSE